MFNLERIFNIFILYMTSTVDPPCIWATELPMYLEITSATCSVRRSSGHAVWGTVLERLYTGSGVRIPRKSWVLYLSFLLCFMLRCVVSSFVGRGLRLVDSSSKESYLMSKNWLENQSMEARAHRGSSANDNNSYSVTYTQRTAS